jgi:cell division protein ZapA (FtsZ GTPase activity inhibitor)
MTQAAVERLTALRRADSQAKGAAVRAALEALVTSGQALTVAAVARHARVSRRFVYDHRELRAAIDLKAAEAIARFSGQLTTAAQVTGASLRADVENTKAENQRLRERIRLLEGRLSEALGHEVASELAGKGIRVTGVMLPDDMADMQAKIDELAGELSRRDDDLEGARQANRDLMAELNRPRARP